MPFSEQFLRLVKLYMTFFAPLPASKKVFIDSNEKPKELSKKLMAFFWFVAQLGHLHDAYPSLLQNS